MTHYICTECPGITACSLSQLEERIKPILCGPDKEGRIRAPAWMEEPGQEKPPSQIIIA